GIVDWRKKKKGVVETAEEEDLGKGNLFATGLVAGGALAGVIIAFMSAPDSMKNFISSVNLEHGITNILGENGYFLLGVLCFVGMGFMLYRIGMSKSESLKE
ncbi:MAG: peptide transporter, partial [Chitinophagaceae bacterium]|nr:peptide transporter [Chitinophagaceae bacterium]